MFMISWRGISVKEGDGIEMHISVCYGCEALIRLKMENFGSFKPMNHQMLTTWFGICTD